MLEFALFLHGILRAVGGFITFLFEAWIVQTLFAAWVAYLIQNKHKLNNNRVERVIRSHDQKKEVTRELFRLVDSRVHATRLYMSELRPGHEWEIQRNQYVSAVQEWNKHASGHVLYMLTIFPARMCYAFDRDVFRLFSEIDSMLRRQRVILEKGKNPSNEIEKLIMEYLNEVEEISRELRVDFLNNAQRDISIIDGTLSVEQQNYRYLDSWFLIQSLFKPGK